MPTGSWHKEEDALTGPPCGEKLSIVTLGSHADVPHTIVALAHTRNRGSPLALHWCCRHVNRILVGGLWLYAVTLFNQENLGLHSEFLNRVSHASQQSSRCIAETIVVEER